MSFQFFKWYCSYFFHKIFKIKKHFDFCKVWRKKISGLARIRSTGLTNLQLTSLMLYHWATNLIYEPWREILRINYLVQCQNPKSDKEWQYEHDFISPHVFRYLKIFQSFADMIMFLHNSSNKLWNKAWFCGQIFG